MYSLAYTLILKIALIEPNNTKYRKLFPIVIALSLILMAGLRSPNVDADYHVYSSRFDYISTLSARELLNLMGSFTIEPGFVLINRFLSMVGLSSSSIFLVIAALAVSIKSYFIYKYSPYIGLGFALYFVHIYLHTEMIQIRGGLAVSILLFSVKPLASRNFKKYLFIVLLAMSVHKMSVLALPLYFLYTPKFFTSYRYIYLGFAICLSSIIYPPVELLHALLGRHIPIFDLYYSWQRYSYSLGYLNPTFLKGIGTFIILFIAREKLENRYGDFYKGAMFLLFIAMIWLFIFRDFAILAARGAAFINTTEFIITPAVIYTFKNKTPIFASVLLLTLLMLYLNIYIKAVVGPYEVIF